MPTDQLTRQRSRTTRTRLPPVAAPPDREVPELQRWVEEVKGLRDLRWEKVQAVRDALAAGKYDLDARAEELIGRLSEELPALSPA